MAALAQSSTSTPTETRPALGSLLASSAPFGSCSCSYPPKTAFRRLKPVALDEVWAQQSCDKLTLQVQVPGAAVHCRCCQRPALPSFDSDQAKRYIDTLSRQVEALVDSTETMSFDRIVLCGELTQLHTTHLESMFELIDKRLSVSIPHVQTRADVCASPQCAAQLNSFLQNGIKHLNVVVHSFVETERQALRLQAPSSLCTDMLQRIVDLGFSSFSIALSYGIAGQNIASLRHSLARATSFGASEIYLCPLYPAETTTRQSAHATERRLEMYRAGRNYLRASAYRQKSLRRFCLDDALRKSSIDDDNCASLSPSPHAQDRGIVGIGFGAISATQAMHYTDQSIMGSSRAATKLKRWCARSTQDFKHVDYGYTLSRAEQGRRLALASLFCTSGLNIERYYAQTGVDILDDIPDLATLITLGLFVYDGITIQATVRGLELADALRPWLFHTT